MKVADTFIPKKYDTHLWIVLSDTSIDSDAVVISNFTTNTKDEEQHCIIKPPEHPFVKHATAVRFRDSKVVSVASLEQLVKAGLLSPHKPLSAALLKKVREGCSVSIFFPAECRRILESQGLI